MDRSFYHWRYLVDSEIPYRCHLGKVVLYDTVTKLKWTVDVWTHSVREIVERLLAEDLEWADEPSPDNDKTISQVTWPWWVAVRRIKTRTRIRIPRR